MTNSRSAAYRTFRAVAVTSMLWSMFVFGASGCEDNAPQAEAEEEGGPRIRRSSDHEREALGREEQRDEGEGRQDQSRVEPLSIPENQFPDSAVRFEAPVRLQTSGATPYHRTQMYDPMDADPLEDSNQSTGICIDGSGTIKWQNMEGSAEAGQSLVAAVWLYVPDDSGSIGRASVTFDNASVMLDVPRPGQWVPTRLPNPVRTSSATLEITGSSGCLTEVRWSRPGDPWVEAAGAWAQPSHCGHPGYTPWNMSPDDWHGYQCRSELAANTQWARCLPRLAYSDLPGRGCPGQEKCCPSN